MHDITPTTTIFSSWSCMTSLQRSRFFHHGHGHPKVCLFPCLLTIQRIFSTHFHGCKKQIGEAGSKKTSVTLCFKFLAPLNAHMARVSASLQRQDCILQTNAHTKAQSLKANKNKNNIRKAKAPSNGMATTSH